MTKEAGARYRHFYDLRPWQEKLQEILVYPAHDRFFWWYVDIDGGSGKTFFTNYILTAKEGVASYGDEKTTDVAFSYEGERIVNFDLSRSCTFKVACDTMEQLMNGRIFSPKYESKMKRFPVPHVANRFPPLFAFSADRLQVRVFVTKRNEDNVRFPSIEPEDGYEGHRVFVFEHFDDIRRTEEQLFNGMNLPIPQC